MYGIHSAADFERYTPNRFVGVLQIGGWCRVTESTDLYTYEYTDQSGAEGFYPLLEAVHMDGTVRPWVCHAKYVAGDDLGSYSGAAPRAWDMSYNTCLLRYHEAHRTHITRVTASFIKAPYTRVLLMATHGVWRCTRRGGRLSREASANCGIDTDVRGKVV